MFCYRTNLVSVFSIIIIITHFLLKLRCKGGVDFQCILFFFSRNSTFSKELEKIIFGVNHCNYDYNSFDMIFIYAKSK